MRTTGVGSMPGSDFREATRIVADVMPDLLAWPEVPGRDASSTMIGRTLGLLPQPSNLTPDGWRLSGVTDTAQQRAGRWWRNDLDDFEELTQHHEGTVKIALAGPWTLASSVRLAHPTLNHVLADEGACRDVAQALVDAAADLAAVIHWRLGRPLIVQIDEPAIGAVLAAGIPTFSGLGRYRVPQVDEVVASWRGLTQTLEGLAGVEGVWLHTCAPGLDVELARRAGFSGLALDARHLDPVMFDACGHWLDEGRSLGLGVVRTDRVDVPSVDRLVTDALATLRSWELDPDLLDAHVVLSPACGLAGWPVLDAGQVLDRLGQAAGLIVEQLRS